MDNKPETKSENKPYVTICYTYSFEDGCRKQFEIKLDDETLALIPETDDLPETWAELSYHQCPACPLNESDYPHCPAALNIAPVIAFFKSFMSYDQVDVNVDTEQRTFRKYLSLQEAVSPLIGLLMAASECPVLRLFRPMLDTHLPFMNDQETTSRIVSMYLIGQYFRHKRGLETDWELRHLKGFLENVSRVNIHIGKRLHNILKFEGDVSINAISILNTLGQLTCFSLDDDLMDRLGVVFRGYFE